MSNLLNTGFLKRVYLLMQCRKPTNTFTYSVLHTRKNTVHNIYVLNVDTAIKHLVVYPVLTLRNKGLVF